MKTVIKKIFIALGIAFAVIIIFFVASTLKTDGINGLKESLSQSGETIVSKFEEIKNSFGDFGTDMLNVESSDNVKVNITGNTSSYEVTTTTDNNESEKPESTPAPKVVESEIHELF